MRLGDQGDRDAGPVGAGALPGRKRGPPDAARVAERVARLSTPAPAVEGVQPLNPGFFQMQRLRDSRAKRGQRKISQ